MEANLALNSPAPIRHPAMPAALQPAWQELVVRLRAQHALARTLSDSPNLGNGLRGSFAPAAADAVGQLQHALSEINRTGLADSKPGQGNALVTPGTIESGGRGI